MHLKGEEQCQVCQFAPAWDRNICQNLTKIMKDEENPDLYTFCI